MFTIVRLQKEFGWGGSESTERTTVDDVGSLLSEIQWMVTSESILIITVIDEQNNIVFELDKTK